MTLTLIMVHIPTESTLWVRATETTAIVTVLAMPQLAAVHAHEFVPLSVSLSLSLSIYLIYWALWEMIFGLHPTFEWRRIPGA